jgi:hypothetical protein
MDVDKLKQIGKDALIRADLKKVKDEIIDDVLEKALDELVNDSKMPFDNIVKSAIYPSLEKDIKARLDKVIDDLLK